MIILASASPRRKELLKKIIPEFQIEASSASEIIQDDIPPRDVAEHLAAKKAMDVFNKHPNDTIIGSDTIIVLDNTIYGKPADKEDAKRMLKLFSGKTHLVITGVCVASSKRTISFSSINSVKFYDLSDSEIDDYLANEEYKDKAGSYAIQGKGALFIKEIVGDYNSIVGLPIAQLYRILKNFFNVC